MKLWITLILSICIMSAVAQTKDRYDRMYDSLQQKGQSEKMIPFLLKEIKTDPKNEAALRMLGYIYIAANQLVPGEKYYRDAIAVNPACARCYMNIAKAYANKNDTKKALELLDKCIGIDSSDAVLYSIRGKLKEMMGDKKGALSDHDKAIAKDPKNADYYLERSDYNARQDYFYPALADLDKAVSLAPGNYLPYFKRADLYHENKMPNEALADINTAIKLDSSQYQLYIGRGVIYAVGNDHSKAIADYDKAIALNPKEYLTFYNRSSERYALEDMDGACADLHESYALLKKYDPGNSLKETLEYSIQTYCDSTKAGYYYQRGIAFYNLQQYSKAVDIYSKGLSKFPGNSMSLSFRGNAYFMQKDYIHALADYYASIQNKENVQFDILANQRHTQLNNESINVYVNAFLASMYISIAESQFALGQYNESLTAINKGIELAPDIKEYGIENYYNVRGNILMALGKYQQAISDFDKCIQKNPAFPLAYVNRAIAKINQADMVTMSSAFISGGINNQGFSANWNFALKNSAKKTEGILIAALIDCNKAITLDPKFEFAYYVRGNIKKILAYSDYCIDLFKAKSLGYPVEAQLIKECEK